MFKEALKSVVEATEGGLAGLLMDFEGIPLEVYAKEGTPFDIEAVGAEISVVVDQNYFLALALDPDGNFGKGRYLLRTSAPKFLEQLV
jgi:hypothetical protein